MHGWRAVTDTLEKGYTCGKIVRRRDLLIYNRPHRCAPSKSYYYIIYGNGFAAIVPSLASQMW